MNPGNPSETSGPPPDPETMARDLRATLEAEHTGWHRGPRREFHLGERLRWLLTAFVALVLLGLAMLRILGEITQALDSQPPAAGLFKETTVASHSPSATRISYNTGQHLPVTKIRPVSSS
jgi:hypothetical protein